LKQVPSANPSRPDQAQEVSSEDLKSFGSEYFGPTRPEFIAAHTRGIERACADFVAARVPTGSCKSSEKNANHHVEAHSASESEAELIAKVMPLKTMIEAVSDHTSERDVLDLLRQLECLGTLSVEVLRSTLVGKALSSLMCVTQSSAAHARAHALLSAWKGSVRQSCPSDLGITAVTSAVTPKKRSASASQGCMSPDASESCAKLKQRKPCDTKRVAKAVTAVAAEAASLPTEGKVATDIASVPQLQRVGRQSVPILAMLETSADVRPATKHADRGGSTDEFVLQLESGESVIMQCFMRGGIMSILNVCGMNGCQLVSEDQMSEAVAFWEELCSVVQSEGSLPVGDIDFELRSPR
jgi:hypothetical protein